MRPAIVCGIVYWGRIGQLLANRPFYQYGGHIELIRFKEYYRMPRGACIFERFSGHFFVKFS